MRKIALISAAAILFLLILLAVAALFVAFTVIKPTTQTINEKLTYHLAKIVYIPQGIGPPAQNFDETSYFWEMETKDKEVIGVHFKHTTGFLKHQKQIIASLEMAEKGDPSIFTKVLPALIVDSQSLTLAKDPQKATLDDKQNTLYSSIKLSQTPTTSQTIKIIWELDKQNLEDLSTHYSKLARFPESWLKLLYNLPHFTLGLLSS